ncbi:hypothetical protein E2C01_073426 [Portunus trituberculatus]|uniref:Uncharacterized protein n=1 Tax=Portunus trituberculatus TaxID=210409 RepID=A0A5B7IAI8_PORTR|nr:hypothetical protein [Portunus trituberculatus]
MGDKENTLEERPAASKPSSILPAETLTRGKRCREMVRLEGWCYGAMGCAPPRHISAVTVTDGDCPR